MAHLSTGGTRPLGVTDVQVIYGDTDRVKQAFSDYHDYRKHQFTGQSSEQPLASYTITPLIKGEFSGVLFYRRYDSKKKPDQEAPATFTGVFKESKTPGGNRYIFNEETILKKIKNHKNIIRIMASCDYKMKKVLFIEHCQMDLKQFITKHQFNLTEYKARVCIRDIGLGLAYLRDEGIVHADIKPANVLLGHGGQCKLCDFELAMTQGTQCDYLKGSLYFMAPEILKEYSYSCRSDYWSLGVTMIEIVTTKEVFLSLMPEDYISKSTTDYFRYLVTQKTPERHQMVDLHINKIIESLCRIQLGSNDISRINADLSKPEDRPGLADVASRMVTDLRAKGCFWKEEILQTVHYALLKTDPNERLDPEIIARYQQERLDQLAPPEETSDEDK